MNWKVFLTASASALLLAIPQNVYTCAGGEDPYDYFTSFFSNKAGTSYAYKPFYYTALLTFYDAWESQNDSLSFVNWRIAEEWKDYAKSNSTDDAVALVYLSGLKEKASLIPALGGQPMPGSLKNNSVAQNLVRDKKGEAIAYLLFASGTENISSSSGWEDKRKDSLEINKWIKDASENMNKVSDPFVKNKYAFQLCKLAFYNNRYADCIRWYDQYFNDANTSAVNQLALSYKAGSLFRIGKNKEAAYAFSKAFPLSDQNKRSNFLGFLWATDHCNQELVPEYSAMAKNSTEKANILGMFAMYGIDSRLNRMQEVYQLNPSSTLLPLLATREINKLEEQYLTPTLQKEKGGKSLHAGWWGNMDENGNPKPITPEPVIKTAAFFEKLMNDKTIPNRSLYAAGAAYLHFITKNYSKAKSLAASAKDLNPDARIKDQLALINLLIVANEGKTITPAIETQMLPSIKWLTDKAKKDREYSQFCRNFFSEILAQKYEQQADMSKAALAYGMADLSFITLPENEYVYSYPVATEFVRNDMNTTDLLKLYETTTSPKTDIEKFFVQNSSVKRDAVVDVIGTSYLRDRDYTKAIEWLSKAGKLEPLIETQYNYKTDKETTVNVDPFHDYLNDWQRFSKSATRPYTKLTLAKKLQELETTAELSSDQNMRSKLYYQLASALYNMSYYGNSWNAVAYDRSGTDWNEGTYDQPWKKEYYGVYKAKEYYQKAYELAADKEFKAACLFMVVKCAQRQIPRPPYDYNNYEQYDKAYAAFEQKFKNNPLFAKFKSEFGTTKFYQYTYNRCSYLRDYVKKNAAPVKKTTNTKPKTKG